MENESQKPAETATTTSSTNPYPVYLLVVAGQTFSKEEKQTVLERIHSGRLNRN